MARSCARWRMIRGTPGQTVALTLDAGLQALAVQRLGD